MKKFAFIISTAILILCFYACTHKPQISPVVATGNNTNTNNNNNNNNTDTTKDIVDTTVCFQRDILPIFTAYCAKSGCHDAITDAKGYNLSSYATIIQKGIVKGSAASSEIYAECYNGKMPKSPTPPLNGTQMNLLKQWINMGAPDDTDCIVNCDTTKFTFSAAIVPILSNYCYSCHSTASAASTGGGIILDTYNGVLIQAQNGKLIGDLQHAPGFNYMPLGGAQLSECKITQVSKWISAGAQNN